MATSNPIAGQMDVFECIEVATQGSDGKPPVTTRKDEMFEIQTGAWAPVMRHLKTLHDPWPFQPVRISVGVPRFWSGANKFPVARAITPYRLRGLTGEDFAAAYRNRLVLAGVDAIAGELETIQQKAGKPLVLLCYEVDRADCHRGQFAEWWQERTGQVVTEVELT